MERNGLSINEIFDLIGIRIIIASDEPEKEQLEHARTIKNAILHSNKFQLMEPHQYPPRPGYKGRTPIHDPIRDTLKTTGHSGYRRARINLEEIEKDSHEDVQHQRIKLPIEVQITTAAFLKYLNDEDNILPPWKSQ